MKMDQLEKTPVWDSQNKEFRDGRAVNQGPGGAQCCPEISLRGQKKAASPLSSKWHIGISKTWR